MKQPKRRRKSVPIILSRQVGLINQPGQGNTQTVYLKQQLQLYMNSCESLKRELALFQALVAAKDETIALLRAQQPQSPGLLLSQPQ
jgi:hypothetical protein